MSLETAGVWAVGVWSTTVWADGVWFEGEAVTSNPATFAVQSLITDEGASVRSAFDTDGVSVAVSGFSSFGVQSRISSGGVSVRSAFDTVGVSVRGKMQG